MDVLSDIMIVTILIIVPFQQKEDSFVMLVKKVMLIMVKEDVLTAQVLFSIANYVKKMKEVL